MSYYGYGGYGGYGQRPGFPPPQPGQPGYPQQPGGQPPPPQYGQQQPHGYGPPGGPPPRGYGPPPPQTGYSQPGAPQGYQPRPGTTAAPPPAGYGGYGPPTVTQNIRPPTYSQPTRQAPGPPSESLNIPQSFPELYNMSKEDLEKLVDDDDALMEFFENRDDIKRWKETRRKAVERNEELATENLSLKPQLESKQEELIDLYSELERQKGELSDLQAQQQALSDHYAPHNILARLKIAASEVEDEAETVSENFLSGEMTIEEFLKTFIPKKTLCHSRRAKEEKMEQMGI